MDEYKAPGYGYSAPQFNEKVPPQNVEAEQSLLGLALTNERARMEIGGLDAEDFYEKRNGLIYDAVRRMMAGGKAVDILSVADFLEHEGSLAAIGGIAYLNSLAEKTMYLNNPQDYVIMIREKSLLREILNFSQSLSRACYAGQQTGDDLLSLMAEKVMNMRGEMDHSSLLPIHMILNRTLQELAKQDSDKLSIDSGFPQLNRMLGRLKRQTLNIIAARPAMGKSALALNIALNVALKNHVVAVFSLEMSHSEVGLRFLTSSSTVKSDDIKSMVAKQDMNPVLQALQALVESRIFVDDSAATTPSDIQAKCRRLKAEEGRLDLVVIDYLQLMTSDGRPQNRQQEISEISRGLKILAKELNVPIIALSQLSRNVESRENKRPMLSDLRESGSIEQDADAVMFLYRDSYYNSEGPASSPEDAELIVAKNRSGATGTIKMSWFPEITTFREKELFGDREAPPDRGYDPMEHADLSMLP